MALGNSKTYEIQIMEYDDRTYATIKRTIYPKISYKVALSMIGKFVIDYPNLSNWNDTDILHLNAYDYKNPWIRHEFIMKEDNKK